MVFNLLYKLVHSETFKSIPTISIFFAYFPFSSRDSISFFWKWNIKFSWQRQQLDYESGY